MPQLRNFKAVVLGAGGVGKSALTIRFGRNVFVEQYNPTIEEEYRCDLIVDDQRCILEILDTPGIEQFSVLNERYLQDGWGFLLVFSLTQASSLKEIDAIRQQIYHFKGEDSVVPIVCVGTKLDLNGEREISKATIQDLSAKWKLPFFETSAKRNWHVSEVFEDLVRQMRKRYPEDPFSRKRRKEPCQIM